MRAVPISTTLTTLHARGPSRVRCTVLCFVAAALCACCLAREVASTLILPTLCALVPVQYSCSEVSARIDCVLQPLYWVSCLAVRGCILEGDGLLICLSSLIFRHCDTLADLLRL
jgi:hypothetical protein